MAGVDAIPGLRVTVVPDLSVFEIGSDELDMAAVSDALAERGFHPDRQDGGLHFMLSPYHARVVDELVTALAASVDEVRAGRASEGGTATYGARRDQKR